MSASPRCFFQVAADHISGQNLLVFKPVSFNMESVCPNCTLEIFEPTVVIVKTGSLSCVACDKDISGC